MKKRMYEKPTMQVVKLQKHAPLICTSGEISAGRYGYTAQDEEEWQ